MDKPRFMLRIFNGDRLINEYEFNDTMANALGAFFDECRRGGSVYLFIFDTEDREWDLVRKCDRPDFE